MKIETVTSGNFQSQTHIAVDEATGECAIIDTGEDGRGIETVVRRLGATPKMVLLTHGHLDHAGGLAAVRRAWPDIPILMHESDLPWVENLEQQGRMFGIRLERPPPVSTIRTFKDGDEIAVGRDIKLETIFTPGHTEGGTTFYAARDKIAFVGDTLFQGSVGRTDLPGGSFRTLVRSIRERLFPLGDDVRCYCGHGPSFTLGEERRNNPFVRIGIEDQLGEHA